MSHRLEWIVAEPEGRAIVKDGDIYFSPNSTRSLINIPLAHDQVKFIKGVSTSAEFQEPRWWTETTEWMGFVPRKPVPYIGSWFSPLAIIPNRLLLEDGCRYGLARFHHEEWEKIDFMLWETCNILRRDFSLQYIMPFLPNSWGYHLPYATFSAAMEHITNARDWFSMWIGLLYWSTRKVPNGPNFAEGLTPPTWFYRVVQMRTDRRRIDAIRSSQLLQNWWLIDRVGLLLHHPDDARTQPSAQWFVDQNVPIWYRWGSREKRSARSTRFTHIRPSPEQLQKATTWITPTPSPHIYANNVHSSYPEPYDPSNNTFSSMSPQHYNLPNDFSPMSPEPYNPSNDFSPMSPEPYDPSNDFSPMSPEPYNPSNNHLLSSLPPECNSCLPSSGPPSPVRVTVIPSSTPNAEKVSEGPQEQVKFSKEGDPIWHYGSGRAVWEHFFEQQRKRHERMLAKETPKAKMARLNRLERPPTSSAPVYVWDWNDDTPPKFVRTTVRKADRYETLCQYSPAQQRYNAFDNEWDCCEEWGEGLEDDILHNPPPPNPERTNNILPEGDWMAARLTEEVERILCRYFGFVAPIPLPVRPPGAKPASTAEKNTLAFVLGLSNMVMSSSFFESPLAFAAYEYLKAFTNKDSQMRPSADMWDLAEENRRTLVYSMRFSAIRTIRRGSETWYMFDYTTSDSTPTWHIAVPTAAAAFYVARLKEDLADSDIAHELVMEGIRFHTVQRRDSLVEAPRELPAAVDIPMILDDHTFTRDDYNLYLEQCGEILASARGRAALMRGGFIRRVALKHVKGRDVLRGPSGIHERTEYMFIAKDLADVEYVDDELTQKECDLLSGLYRKFLGKKREVVQVCWYPQAHVFDKSGVNLIRWSDYLEAMWEKRSWSILNDELESNTFRDPLNVKVWRDRLRGHGDARLAYAKLEKWSLERLGSI